MNRDRVVLDFAIRRHARRRQSTLGAEPETRKRDRCRSRGLGNLDFQQCDPRLEREIHRDVFVVVGPIPVVVPVNPRVQHAGCGGGQLNLDRLSKSALEPVLSGLELIFEKEED